MTELTLPIIGYMHSSYKEKFGIPRQPNLVQVESYIETGEIFEKIGLPRFNPETDRAMLCGSPAFLDDVAALLDQHGLKESPRMGVLGDYVIERAFVEK